METLTDATAEPLPADAAAAAVGVPDDAAARERLIQQVERLLRESGNTEPFDAAAWVDRWLRRPNHALGGATPELYLHAPAGEAVIAGLIGAMAAGSYL
ncbi:MbcA/ParS/Xre antitoxin family protein [Cyanobium sp. FGCU-6]|nr:MbcA/ParS/Xre antitoxin family protein [Cyanobium sp. FGCU6]